MPDNKVNTNGLYGMCEIRGGVGGWGKLFNDNHRPVLRCELIVFLSGEWERIGSETTSNRNFNLLRALFFKITVSKRL